MARWIVAGLIALNLMLGAGVYQRLCEQKANAQIGRGAPQIATVAGQANGSSVVYMLNVSTGELVAIRNEVAKGVTVIDRVDVAAAITRIR